MTLRDTRLGRWVRRHPGIHAFIHATWCRAVGPFDTRRVATTNTGATGGGGPSVLDYELTIGPTTYKFPTLAAAQAYANANQPDNIYTVFAVYSDGSTKVAYSGPKTGTSTGTTPAYSSFVVFYSTGGGVQYKTTTQDDALAWAKANAPVGVTYSIFGINGGQHFITGGLGAQTGQAAVSQIGTVANPVPGLNAQVITGPPSVNTSANPPVQVGWRVTGVGAGVNGPQTTYDAVDYDYSSAVADAKAFQQQGLTGITIVPLYSQ